MTKANDNKKNVLEIVQEIIFTYVLQVANDYKTLFAVPEEDDSGAAELFSQRHKQGKVILSHLEALLKINATYIEKPQTEKPEEKMSDDYKDILVQTARKSLKEKS